MIQLKSQREIENMKESGSLLASIHEELRNFIKVGVTTLQIDQFVQEKIESVGAIAAQIGYQGYQFATCTSLNDEICHGFPSNYALKSGDLIKVDFCVDLNGAISDSCWSYPVGNLNPGHERLMAVTQQALYLGIEQAVIGNRIGDIGHAIQTYVEEQGFGVVRDFIGHGIGPTIHEEPAVPHYGQAGKGLRLKEGMTITIEPMVTMGSYHSVMDHNGWTARTRDRGYCAQYEHSIAITSQGPIILTQQNNE